MPAASRGSERSSLALLRRSRRLGVAQRRSPVIAGGCVAFLVGEAEHGNLDLNGHGDALDDVLHGRATIEQ